MADTELAMTRGRRRDFTVTVLNTAGDPQDLTGRSLKFLAKRNVADADGSAIITKATSSGITHATRSGPTLGQATIQVDVADTAALPNYSVALWCEVVLLDSAVPYAVVPDVPPPRFWLLVGPNVVDTP
jgi:hypothetical protein